MVVVGGSDGGPGGPVMAALLAGHGLPVLSMAYWGHPGHARRAARHRRRGRRPACDWLRAQDGVDDVPPCVVGLSRGGELVLLAAALTPDHVGPAASSRWAAGSPGARGGRGPTCCETAWRFGGEPVPQMDEDEDDPDACIDDADMVASAEIARRARDRTGADAQRARTTPCGRARGSPGSPRRAPSARAPATGSPTSPTPAPGTSARRRRATRSSPTTRSAAAAAGAGNQAARLDAWRRILEFVGADPMSEFQDGDRSTPTTSSGCGRRTGWPTSAARTSRPTASEGECPFCRIPGLDDEAGLVVRRGETAYAVLNLYPYTAGHLMVCPYRHIADYTEVTDEESAEIGAMTRAAMRTVRAVSTPRGSTSA